MIQKYPCSCTRAENLKQKAWVNTQSWWPSSWYSNSRKVLHVVTGHRVWSVFVCKSNWNIVVSDFLLSVTLTHMQLVNLRLRHNRIPIVTFQVILYLINNISHLTVMYFWYSIIILLILSVSYCKLQLASTSKNVYEYLEPRKLLYCGITESALYSDKCSHNILALNWQLSEDK